MRKILIVLSLMALNICYGQIKVDLMNGEKLQVGALKPSKLGKQSINLDGNDIEKSAILLYNEKGKNFTFNNKNFAKTKIKGVYSIDDNCDKGKVLAFKYYNSRMSVGSIPLGDQEALNDELLQNCYNEKVRQIKNGQTVGWVVAGVSFSLSLVLFISAVSQASSM